MSVTRLLFKDGRDGSITVTLVSPEGRTSIGSSSSSTMSSTGAINGFLDKIGSKRVEDVSISAILGMDFVDTSRRPIESNTW